MGLTTHQVAEVQAPVHDVEAHGALGLKPSAPVDLQAFFARPVRLSTITITATGTNGALDVFALWRAVASVKEKLSRYGYFRGTMELTFSCNGNPYQYGSVVMATRSIPIDPTLSNFDWSNIRTHVILGAIAANGTAQLYQLPHLLLDPAAETDRTLQCELMSTTGWVPLLGTLPNVPVKLYYACTALANSSGSAVTPLVINVYARVINAEVSVPVLQAQSGKEASQAGILEQIATATSNAALAFSSIPRLGPWATSFAAAAKLGARVAAVLGWARPLALDVQSVVAWVSPTFAYMTGGRMVAHGTGSDPLRSVGVGAAAGGYGSDSDSSLTKIASVPGYLGYATLATTAVANDLVWSTVVNPMVAPTEVISTVVHYYPTPLTYVTAAASTWTGSIKYQFILHASAFHKGTVRLVYDPTGLSTSSTAAAADPSLLLSKVVHVNGVVTVDFEVPWSQPHVFADVGEMNTIPSLDTSNGILYMFVDSPLQCNGVSAPVRIDIFVSAGAGFTWGRPTLPNGRFRPVLAAQSGVVDIVDNVAKPHLVTYGEKVESVLSLTRRLTFTWVYQNSTATFATSNTGTRLYYWLPAFLPLIANGASTAGELDVPGYSFTQWFEAIFKIQRGGYRLGLHTYGVQADTTGIPPEVVIGAAEFPVSTGSAAISTSTGVVTAMSSMPSRFGATPCTDGKGVYELGPVHRGYFRVSNAGIPSGSALGSTTTNPGPCFGYELQGMYDDALFYQLNCFMGGADDYTLFAQDVCPALVYT